MPICSSSVSEPPVMPGRAGSGYAGKPCNILDYFMIILGIETSCDETSVSVLEGKAGRFIVRSHWVSSQVRLHAQYGGVVPEVAARRHVEVIIALKEAHIKLNDIDVIAVTAGPGLITALLVGVETARALAWSLHKPLAAVNHLEGHLYANWLPDDQGKTSPALSRPFPVLGLIVSGGHTELVLMKKHGQYRILGETLDDAAGEAFDKVAKLMGLGYPGGPALARLAERGNPNSIHLPRPMLNSSDFNFSFAGLKTAARYHIDKHKLNAQSRRHLAASFEQAEVDVLVHKALRALRAHRIKTFCLAGGVAANLKLRRTLQTEISRRHPRVACLQPNLKYCTDNASMIAVAGYFHALRKDFMPWTKLDVDPNWRLGSAQSSD